MNLEVYRFGRDRIEDFELLHSESHGAGWCHCVAWWVPTWDGFGDRLAEQNRALRRELCERGEYDGYLLYVDGAPAGWCQAGPRNRLAKLVAQYALEPSPGTWAITCFFIAPDYRRRGLASHLLREVLVDLHQRGAERVEAFPKRGSQLDTLDLWTGPEAIFLAAGFQVEVDDPARPVLVKRK